MTHLRKPRFWLLTTAALIIGAPLSASAQNSNVYHPGAYNVGAPTMVAAAPSLPNIPADQIARDVTAEHNPRTGQVELIAAPFDPFEEDPYMAGSLRLRTADGAVAIDGQPLRGGALVDIDFYYNSPSDDPYGGRNYSNVSFVSGDLAPVVLRDARILECSTRVENVAYDHNIYYSPATYSRYGIYQPYRHYAGHSAFGFGFGSSYYGPGINLFFNNRSRLARTLLSNRRRNNSRSFLPRLNTPNTGFRGADVRRGRVISPRLGTLRGRAVAAETNTEIAPVPAVRSAAAIAASERRREIRNRIGNRRLTADDFRVSSTRGTNRNLQTEPRLETRTPRRRRGAAARRSQFNAAPNAEINTESNTRVSPRVGSVFGRRGAVRGTAAGQARAAVARPNTPKQSAPQPSAPKQSAPKTSQPKTRAPKRNAPKKSASRRSESKKATSKRSTPKRSKPSSSSRSSRSSRSSSSGRSSSLRNRVRNFFPTHGNSGRGVVTSHSVDCAREDKLSVFIPTERLEAARFDGLTLIALDAQGGETPIYIPPNYIQGYRLAATGRVQPQGIQQQGFTPAPQAQFQQQFQGQQGRAIEPATCPVGTQLHPNGTCLQTGQAGYPTR